MSLRWECKVFDNQKKVIQELVKKTLWSEFKKTKTKKNHKKWKTSINIRRGAF